MAKIVDAPRIEILLTPDDQDREGDIKPGTLFDLRLVLHLPEGQPAQSVLLNDGPFDREGAATRLSEIWGYLRDRYEG